jgi:hypothetical protein
MTTPLPVLRKLANEVLLAFTTTTGHDPEEVWERMMASKEMPEFLTEYLEGDNLWGQFQRLRSVEVRVLENSRP